MYAGAGRHALHLNDLAVQALWVHPSEGSPCDAMPGLWASAEHSSCRPPHKHEEAAVAVRSQHLQLLADLRRGNVRHKRERLHALPQIQQKLLQLHQSLNSPDFFTSLLHHTRACFTALHLALFQITARVGVAACVKQQCLAGSPHKQCLNPPHTARLA